jgi:hypothetical protein
VAPFSSVLQWRKNVRFLARTSGDGNTTSTVTCCFQIKRGR